MKQDRVQIQARQVIEKVQTNIFEDVLAGPGSCQIIAVASENLLSAARITAEAGATQWIGYRTSNTLEKLLQDREGGYEAQ